LEITNIVEYISNNGFAIAVAIYSLTRLENTIKENTRAITIMATKLGVNINE
jgi:hypothetical protein